MSIRRRLVTSGPGILDRGVSDRGEPVNRNFHHSIEEIPINTEVECWRFLSITHSEKHSATFAMEIKARTEIDHKRPPPRRPGERFCCPDKPAQRHYRNIDACHLSNH